MPYELLDLTPAMRFVERAPECGLLLSRSLCLGHRPGFAAIVDDEQEPRALLLVERPSWKSPGPKCTRIQVEAVDSRSAMRLLAWIPPVAHVQLYSYRPWLQELAHSLMQVERVAQSVYCQVRPRQFRPSPLQAMVTEIPSHEVALRRQAQALGGMSEADRLFAILQRGEIVACAGLAGPEGDSVAVRGIHTRPADRRKGYGMAVLSAATQAGLASGRSVICGLPVGDLPSLHLVANLGFSPACREWLAEGNLLP